MTRALLAAMAALAMAAVAGPAAACRHGGNQRVLLYPTVPTFAEPSDLVLSVRIRSVDQAETRAVADVLAVERGRFRGRTVRIAVGDTARCGPATSPGATGLVVGRLKRMRDGWVLAPRTVTLDALGR